ncbi:thiamine ABC transporter ATP-binding protein [Shimia aestuarii]|uniref:Thiamine transport system ATP-binding protein n=1 Tax=Shimia aestuarii TaxID=254406 RepID=A0A1I4JRU8_9RHOB|nr:thiamine ABC transporter ATP-binding protein [Shimia aestuarii]SFL68937.1 thiamine transport system ATP-binding protein [Shimia aestuarii]
MLTLEGISIVQGDFRLSADFSVEDSTRVAVIGPSGAGKSTLLSLIAGFLEPVAGRVLWNDEDITATAPGARPAAMLFQDNNLFPHLSAAQNVGLGLRPDLRLSGEDTRRVEEALARVGLAGYGARKPSALSGGQQSRVALARVLVQDRPLVLLDEPFSALGPALKAEMLDLLAELLDETGATLLMVSHDPEDARRVAQRTILVADGAALAPQDTAPLLDNPPPALKAYLG